MLLTTYTLKHSFTECEVSGLPGLLLHRTVFVEHRVMLDRCTGHKSEFWMHMSCTCHHRDVLCLYLLTWYLRGCQLFCMVGCHNSTSLCKPPVAYASCCAQLFFARLDLGPRIYNLTIEATTAQCSCSGVMKRFS